MNLFPYILRPYMPLPDNMAGMIGLGCSDLDCTGREGDCRFPYTWSKLTDLERDLLWQMYPPVAAVASFDSGGEKFLAVAGTDREARDLIVGAWRAHRAEHLTCCGEQPDYPVGDETAVLTGPYGSVWRDGSLYPKALHPLPAAPLDAGRGTGVTHFLDFDNCVTVCGVGDHDIGPDDEHETDDTAKVTCPGCIAGLAVLATE